MKVVVLYRSNSEHERTVIEFEREYNRRTGRSFDKVDLNTPEGAEMARLYDIIQYPAILAVSDDGVLQQAWQGEPLPLMNEVEYYHSANQA